MTSFSSEQNFFGLCFHVTPMCEFTTAVVIRLSLEKKQVLANVWFVLGTETLTHVIILNYQSTNGLMIGIMFCVV